MFPHPCQRSFLPCFGVFFFHRAVDFCSDRDDFKFLHFNQLQFGSSAYTDSYNGRRGGLQNGDVRMRTVKRIMQILMPSRGAGVAHKPRHLFGKVMTPDYLRRREMVKNFWLVAGIAMMALPLLHWIVAVSLFTTFVSLMYLDEAPVLAEEWYDRH